MGFLSVVVGDDRDVALHADAWRVTSVAGIDPGIATAFTRAGHRPSSLDDRESGVWVTEFEKK
jgi:hypothetical protein